MPRLPRIQLPGARYYVTAKGSTNQELFMDKADYRTYMELVAKYKSQHQFQLFSYCLLPDRLYLLIETGEDATISEIMHDLNSLYTKYFNGRYQKKGHLFESRFKSVLIEKITTLLPMTRHIHRMPPNPAEYPHTSYHIYVRHASIDDINISAEVNEVKDFLKAKDDESAYERYCLSGEAAEIEDLEKRLNRASVVGADSFMEEVRGKLKEYAEAQKEVTLSAEGVRRPNRVLVLMIGLGILVATSSSVYLYISKRAVETKYQALLYRKETEFVERTRFENRSPLALQELEGTVWEIEMLPMSSDKSGGLVRDQIRFENGRFSSRYFSEQGYKGTRFTLTRNPNGATWETIQSHPNGDSVSWRGDWQGDAMKGVAVIRPAGQSSRDFSFFSVKWSYQGQAQAPIKGALQ